MQYETTTNCSFIQNQMSHWSLNFLLEKLAPFQFMDWFHFFDKVDLSLWKEKHQFLNEDVDYIISLGIGGSFHGLESVVYFLGQEAKWRFLGNSFDPIQIKELKKEVSGKKIGVTVISKMGKTLEILLFIDLLKELFNEAEWIVAISSFPAFYEDLFKDFKPPFYSMKIDQYTGGRYSLFSEMGLFVLFLCHVSLESIREVILKQKDNWAKNFLTHHATLRGVSRYLSQTQGNTFLEVLSTNHKKLLPTLGWVKQLFAESDGKNEKGLFVTSTYYPQDAHSLGQIFKEGKKVFIETFYTIESLAEDLDLNGNTFSKVKECSLNAINKAFINAIIQERKQSDIDVNVYRLQTDSIQELMELFFSEMGAIILECVLLGVNPFDQPGVESYKQKIRSRLF
jgi:glucose-6-phosphate isomerase